MLASLLHFRAALCANDVETITRREFTLEGRGRNIPWCQRRRVIAAVGRRSVSTILRQPVLEFKLGFLRVEVAG